MAKSVKSYKIAVIGGDGTGPEVIAEAVKVINTAAAKFGFKLDMTHFDFGGERYKRTGETLPDSAVAELRKFDSILLGAIGHPDVKPGILEKGILLKLRFELDQVRMQVELFDGGLERRQKPDGESDAARGLQDIDAAAHALEGSGQIGGAALEKMRPLGIADDFPREVEQALGRDGFADHAQLAADAHRGRQAALEVQVAGVLLPGGCDQ